MESEGQPRQQRIACFWKRYIWELRRCQVPDSALPWYRRHVQAFIDFAPGTRLVERRPEILQRWFANPGQGPRLRDWQQRQRVDALRLLYCHLIKTEWALEFDWGTWTDPRRAPMKAETTGFDNPRLPYIAQKPN